MHELKVLISPCIKSIAGSLATASTSTIFTVMVALQMMLVLLYCDNAIAVSVLSLIVSSISVIVPSLNPLLITFNSAASVPLTKNSTSLALAWHWNTTISPLIILTDSGDTSISCIVKKGERKQSSKVHLVCNE